MAVWRHSHTTSWHHYSASIYSHIFSICRKLLQVILDIKKVFHRHFRHVWVVQTGFPLLVPRLWSIHLFRYFWFYCYFSPLIVVFWFVKSLFRTFKCSYILCFWNVLFQITLENIFVGLCNNFSFIKYCFQVPVTTSRRHKRLLSNLPAQVGFSRVMSSLMQSNLCLSDWSHLAGEASICLNVATLLPRLSN